MCDYGGWLVGWFAFFDNFLSVYIPYRCKEDFICAEKREIELSSLAKEDHLASRLPIEMLLTYHDFKSVLKFSRCHEVE